MDIVHSHAVKNEIEGLGNFAGDPINIFTKEVEESILLGTHFALIMVRMRFYISY